MGRGLNDVDAFEMAIECVLGERIRADDEVAKAMWSALVNLVWVHESGDAVQYTFRSAGDLVATVRGRGDYMDWYCSGPYGVVSDEIAAALASQGWRAGTGESDA